MSKSEEYQRVWHDYETAYGGTPATPREIVDWGVARGLLALPKIDPRAQLAEDMARAMREEYRTDPHTGRRYRANHAVRVTADGVQFALWADMRSASRNHMVKAFAQRRQQIVGDCLQLKTDVDVFNATRSFDEPVQLVLDFTDDIAELQVWVPEIPPGLFRKLWPVEYLMCPVPSGRQGQGAACASRVRPA